MNSKQSAWESFQQTGKIDDYLDYCQARKQEMLLTRGGGAKTGHATTDQWDYPAGYQNRRR